MTTNESIMPIVTETVANSQDFTEKRQKTIDWLISQGLPPLPVAPRQDPQKYPKKDKEGRIIYEKDGETPQPLFCGKNPSYLDENGKPHIVKHGQYREQLPSEKDIEKWFKNPENGIGTLGGWNGTEFIDIDSKRFGSQDDCDRAFNKLLETNPILLYGLLEKTHSGGYRIGIKSETKPEFTNFSLSPDGEHIGECLGEGRFTVLSPTIGGSGNSYESLNRPDSLPIVSKIDFLYPHSKKKKSSEPRQRINRIESTNGVSLYNVITPTSKEILNGTDIKGDRSESLTTLANDVYGWENWLNENNIIYNGNSDDLIRESGQKLGLDDERIERIIKSIDTDSRPSAESQGGDISCWKKIYKLDKNQVPSHIKKEISGDFKSNQSNKSGDNLIPQNEWQSLKELNYEMGKFEDIEVFFDESQEDEAQEYIKNKPNLILVKSEQAAKNKDGELKKSKGKKVLKFNPLSDFTFNVERVLHSDYGGGYVLRIERVIKGMLHTGRVTVNTESFQKVSDFILAVSQGLKTSVIYNGDIKDLKNTLKVKVNDYYMKGGVEYRLTDRIGCQSDGVWVFKNCQLTKDGKPTDEETTKWVYNDRLSQDDHIPSPTILEPDPQALPRLVSAIKQFSGDNYPRFLLVLGFAAAAAHYKEIIEKEKSFPIMNPYGDPGSLKTVAAESAMSIFGWHKDGSLSYSSESALYERLKFSGSLLNYLDDPTRDEKTEEIFKRLYNALPRVVRGNHQKPHSPILVSSNHVYGDNSQATRTRLIRLYFPKVTVNRSAFSELNRAQDMASGALPYIIGLGYPKHEIDNLESELINYVPLAHVRIAKSLALLTYYTSQVVRLANAEIDIKKWVIDNLCNTENDKENDKDSLTDFMEKVQILLSKANLGEWNVKTVARGDKVYTALVLNEVWTAVDKEFSPPYSLALLKALAKDAASIDNSTQKFNTDRDTTLAWRRNQLLDSNQEKPPTKSKKCWLIPIELSGDPDYEPPVTSVTSGYHPSYQKGNQQNPYPVSDSADNAPPVTSVTFFNEYKEEEEEVTTDLLTDSKSKIEDQEKSDFSEKKGNQGNQYLKPLHSKP